MLSIDNKIKKINDFEKFALLLNDVNPMNFVGYIMLNKDINIEMLKFSIKEIYKNTKIFNSNIGTDNGDYFFFENDELNDCEIIEVETEKWEESLADLCNIKIDAFNEKLAKFSLVKTSSDLILAIIVNHIVGDGISVLNILKEIIRFYDCENFSINNVVYQKQLYEFELNESIDEKTKDNLEVLSLPKSNFDSSFDNYDINTAFKNCTFDTEISLKIFKLCKMNNVTVHSFLSAVQALSLWQAEKLVEGKCKVVISTVSLRNKTKEVIDNNILGNYFSFVPVPVILNENVDIWDVARKIKLEINRNIASGEVKEAIRKMQVDKFPIVKEASLKFFEICNSVIPKSSLISNIGNVEDIVLTNNDIINGLGFAAPPTFLSYEIFTTISTFRDVLNVNFNYNTNCFSEDKIKGIIQNFKLIIKECI